MPRLNAILALLEILSRRRVGLRNYRSAETDLSRNMESGIIEGDKLL